MQLVPVNVSSPPNTVMIAKACLPARHAGLSQKLYPAMERKRKKRDAGGHLC